MDRIAVGFDIDGVLYDWHSSVVDWYNLYYNREVSFTEFWSNFSSYIPDSSLLERNLMGILHLYTCNQVRNSVLDKVRELSKHCDLYCITGRHPDLTRLTLEFFKKQGIAIPESNFFFVSEKSEIINELGISYYVEDHIKYLNQVLDGVDKIKIGLVNRPYNRKVEITDSRVTRFCNVEAFIDFVLEDIGVI